mmetsp:Transcript_155893/g.499803  ORF Transcript_155893/g.499803 Transcript_155893/m.499803 type:complete len:233 (+) Transcript_155893:408-1106(+)
MPDGRLRCRGVLPQLVLHLLLGRLEEPALRGHHRAGHWDAPIVFRRRRGPCLLLIRPQRQPDSGRRGGAAWRSEAAPQRPEETLAGGSATYGAERLCLQPGGVRGVLPQVRPRGVREPMGRGTPSLDHGCAAAGRRRGRVRGRRVGPRAHGPARRRAFGCDSCDGGGGDGVRGGFAAAGPRQQHRVRQARYGARGGVHGGEGIGHIAGDAQRREEDGGAGGKAARRQARRRR